MNIAPSILDADFSRLQQEINTLKDCPRIHLDIMDGQYVPNTSLISGELEHIDFPVPIEAHLMVQHPEDYFDEYIDLGCMGITFHIETQSTDKTVQLLQELRDQGLKAGICVDGYTDVDVLTDEILEHADQVLIMSIKAGKGGQSFMPEHLEKVRTLRTRGYKGEIEIDGGVKDTNIQSVKDAGVDIAVVGSFLMKQPIDVRQELLQALFAA